MTGLAGGLAGSGGGEDTGENRKAIPLRRVEFIGNDTWLSGLVSGWHGGNKERSRT